MEDGLTVAQGGLQRHWRVVLGRQFHDGRPYYILTTYPERL